MRKFFDFLFSMQFAGTLLLVFAGVIGAATFVENDLGTLAARIIVYDSHWFEGLLLLMSISMFGSIFKYKLYQRKKHTVLIFHISFIIILIGSAITRYIGEEGNMRIREGESSNQIISQQSYIQVSVNNGVNRYNYSDKKLFNPYNSSSYDKTLHFNNESSHISMVRFVPNAAETIVEDPTGKPIISVVTMGRNGQEARFIRKGESVLIGNVYFSFETGNINPTHVQIIQNSDGYFFISPFEVSYTEMTNQSKIVLDANTMQRFELMKLYSFGGTSLVIQKIYDRASTRLVAGPASKEANYNDAVIFNISYYDKNEQVTVFGGQGAIGEASSVKIDGIEFTMSYGSKIIDVPFSLYLRDFQLDRYPGSMSPSSFASEVTLIDKRNNIEEPRRIFMNNVLNYNGYRFFQSSYDQDEKGTILSVNHDRWGTFVTYIGYFIMALGMILNFFHKDSRFRHLMRLSAHAKKAGIVLLMVTAGILSSNDVEAQYTAVDASHYIDASHAKDFGQLMVLDQKGRIEPINTLSSEIVRKVTKKGSFMGLSSDQVFLGMIADPGTWQSVAMIKISDPELGRLLSVRGNLASFNDFIDYNKGGSYKLSGYVDAAYKKKPAGRTGFDKEIIKVDERVNICYMVYSGDFMNIFPLKDDKNNGWYAVKDSLKFAPEDRAFVKNVLPMYYGAVLKGIQSGNWNEATQSLTYIKTFQEKFGSQILPSKIKTKIEITYNKLNIFKRLFPFYSLVGFIMLILLFAGVMNPKYKFVKVIKIGIVLIILGFAFQTIGLGVRWYISGHAPWSNGYESMIYISWATVLAGLFFIKKSKITVATTVILASLTLMVANMSWMDPEITNLVPVLKSYWLVIHVAVITASYSFLAIGALLGFLNLVMMILKNPKNKDRINATIKELTNINEMNLIIGGFLLTIGTFLGAVWANESWGRYWGWDPKETWALVTVVVYAFIVHMRLTPGLKGTYAFNFGALISFSSVLMTYFGVNYYLSGMHSYAKGDPVPIPVFVYYTVAVIFAVSIWAYIKENKQNAKIKSE